MFVSMNASLKPEVHLDVGRGHPQSVVEIANAACMGHRSNVCY